MRFNLRENVKSKQLGHLSFLNVKRFTYRQLLIYLSLLIVVLIRFLLYCQNNGLFLDEVNLARNLIERNFLDYFTPLDYNQHAPLLFLWLSDIFSGIFGDSEYVLRLWPLIAGLISVILFQKILKNHRLPWTLSIIGVFFLGLNIVSVKYGIEVKQYSTDLLITSLLLLTWQKFQDGRLGRQLFMIIGGLSIFLSMPAVFTLLAIFAVSLRSEFVNRKQIIPVFFFWGFVFLVNYYFFLLPSLKQQHLQEFHNDYFLTFPLNFDSLIQFSDQMIMILRGPFGKTFLAIITAFIFIFIGTLSNWKQSIVQLSFYALLLVLFASMLRKYSLIERLMLFTYPFFYILFLSGIHASWIFIQQKQRLWSKWYTGLILVLLIIILGNDQRFVWAPKEELYGESIRDGLSNLDKSELIVPVVLTHNAWPYYDYYVIKRGMDLPRNSKDYIIMDWEASQLDSIIEEYENITLIDAHTFGKEKEKLLDKMKGYPIREVIISQEFSTWIMQDKD